MEEDKIGWQYGRIGQQGFETELIISHIGFFSLGYQFLFTY